VPVDIGVDHEVQFAIGKWVRCAMLNSLRPLLGASVALSSCGFCSTEQMRNEGVVVFF
jgi:hypothetical protein